MFVGWGNVKIVFNVLVNWSFLHAHAIERVWRVMSVGYQSDLVNTKESGLPVCKNAYHTNKRDVQTERTLKFCRTMHWAKTEHNDMQQSS